MSRVADLDSERLDGLLSVDVWLIVLKRIEISNRATFLAVLNCSQYFHERLKTRRTAVLFSDVYTALRNNVEWQDVKPIVVTKNPYIGKTETTMDEKSYMNVDSAADEFYDQKMLYPESDDETEEESDSNDDDNEQTRKSDNQSAKSLSAPDLYVCDSCGKNVGCSWLTNILNLRFVCKVWKKTVDNFYLKNYTQESRYVYLSRQGFTSYRHFLKTHGKKGNVNPFLFSCALLELNDENIFFINALKLVRMYGKFFDNVYITMYDSEELGSKPVLFPRLEDVLFNVPNVKCLTIEGSSDNLVKESLLGLTFELSKLIEVDLFESKDATVVKYVLGKSPNLTSLKLREDYLLDFNETGTACSSEFHNLVNLTTLRVVLSVRMKTCLFDCFKFKLLNCLSLKFELSEFYLPFRTLLTSISKNWGNTLEILKLKYNRLTCYTNGWSEKKEKVCNELLNDSIGVDCIRFGKLKVFKLSCHECFLSTNFLTSSRSTLEDVKIKIHYNPMNNADNENIERTLQTEKINFLRLINSDDEQQQFWKVFGSLKRIEYKLETFAIKSKLGEEIGFGNRNIICCLSRP